MTEPGEERVGVFLAEAVQKIAIADPFSENEEVESERIRVLSRAVRSRGAWAGKAGRTLGCLA